jgi:hypothetical protein
LKGHAGSFFADFTDFVIHACEWGCQGVGPWRDWFQTVRVLALQFKLCPNIRDEVPCNHRVHC